MMTRRNLFQFVGGTAAGALLTPAPWRLIKDASLWSENWPGIPRPARGPVEIKRTNCSLCTAGCPVRARCVGGRPVSLAGAQGGLCPFGVAAHHLPYHPARIRTGQVKEAVAAITRRIQRTPRRDRVAVLDLRPGRTASWTYRRAMAAMPNGLYLAPPQPEFAVNLANARTVVSLGVPLLDGWGTPAKVCAARRNFRLIQIEPVESRTAALADVWLPARPADLRALVKDAEAPVVLDPDGSPEVMELNREIGAMGTILMGRGEAPVPAGWKEAAPVSAIEDAADGSIGVLLIDESAPGEYIPWSAIQPKLAREAVVAAFAWSPMGYARHAAYALPTAVYPEALDDIPPAIDSPAVFRLSVSLMAPPAGVVNPVEFVARLAGFEVGDPLRERAEAIQKGDAFWKALNAGETWMGEWGRPPGLPTRREARFARWAGQEAYPTEPLGSAMLMSPLMTKLYQESNLRLAPNYAAISPEAARQLGVANGARAFLETRRGRCAVEIAVDPALPSGAIEIAARPAVLDICAPGEHVEVVRI